MENLILNEIVFYDFSVDLSLYDALICTSKNALKAFIVICVVLIVVIGSFYFWFRNHPTVDITINKGSAGEQLDIETPNIAINEQFGIKSSAEVELKVLNIVDQHEFVCYDLRENYKTSDIKLDIVKADEHLVLKYTHLLFLFFFTCFFSFQT